LFLLHISNYLLSFWGILSPDPLLYNLAHNIQNGLRMSTILKLIVLILVQDTSRKSLKNYGPSGTMIYVKGKMEKNISAARNVKAV